MRKKIISLVLTGIAFAIVTYAASSVNNENLDVEILEVSEMGLNSTDLQDDKLNRLIHQYEFISPEETPWQTCQQ
jgi:hypothetical protein